jgi:phage terminase large subunit-like protein
VAAPYKPETCAYCQADTWCEIRKNGKPQCRACKVERFFTEILYPPIGLQLMVWQRKVIRDIYGTVLPADGSRQYRHGYISVAKQNGKSFLFGGLPIYHLLMEDEVNPEAYGCASAKDQASIVYTSAARMVQANPDLLARLDLRESTKRILRKDGGGVYAVLSADGGVQDGKRPSLLLRDEVHRWKSGLAKTLHDVLTKGQISRNEPLDLGISTAGAEYESPLWHREYSFAKQILAGAVNAPTYYAAIWEPDLKRIDSDPEYWKSREARVAANPSHEDLGGFLKDAAISSEMEKALAQPSEKSTYLRYNLNCPVQQEEDPIVDLAAWQACDGGEDLRTWPDYDFEYLVKKWNLIEKPCFAGVDASWSVDFTAVVFVFPPFGPDRHGLGSDQWTLLAFFFVPDRRIPDLERICRVPIAAWVTQKFINATPGKVIDQREVMDRIRWGAQMFDLQEMPYDRCNFRSEALNLVDEGIVAPEVPQTFMGLSQATKFLLSQYLEKGFRHANNPVLNWHASCLQLQYDHKDNCQPSKPDRGKSRMRIDGMQATITALSRAIVTEDNSINYTGLRSVG